MLSTLLILAASGPAPQALERFAQFIRQAETLSVDCKVTILGAPAATGRLVFERPRRVLFTMTWDKSRYSFSSTEQGVLEIEHATKRYDEWRAQRRLVAPQSRISQTPQLGFPAVLVLGDVHALIPDDARIEYLGKATIAGAEVDHVQATYATQRGPGQTDAFIDGAGRLLRLGSAVNGDEGPLVYAQEYSNYRVNQKMALSQFLTPIPVGFVPHTLPASTEYFDPGQKFTEYAFGRKDGAPERLTYSGKGSLVAFTGPDCAISARASKALSLVREAAGANGWEFVEISDARRASDAKSHSGAAAVRFDPGGQAWDELGAQGTPSLWIIDGSGIVRRYWFGFDPAHEDAWVAEVKGALEGKSSDE